MISDVDLRALARTLGAVVHPAHRVGRVVGKTALRDAAAAHLGCSLLEAEQLVDTLIANGLLRLVREGEAPDAREVWTVGEP